MLNMNMVPSEHGAVVATIDPQSLTAGNYLSDAIDMMRWEMIMVVITVGTMSASGTLDAKVTQATTSGGTYKDVTGSAITQLTQAGSDSNKQVVINVRREDLDFKNDYRYVKVSVTTATAASLGAVVVLGFGPRYGVASDNDLSDVDEIVTA